ncbi:MAG: polysaccharide biosynthesis C-terminal domain-containing protein [Saprospiraceae bacterium]|nr:polysaccharide biosynthesis C-terminal domain-containing protein [Saprospiraceae bacterium]
MLLQISPLRALQIFNVGRQGSLILIAVLLAQLHLPTAELGNYEQLLFIGHILSFFLVSGLIQGMLSYYPELNAAQQQRFLFNALLLFLLIGLLVVCIAWVGRAFFWSFVVHREQLSFYSLFLIYVVLNFPSFLIENHLVLQQNGWHILRYGLLSFSAQLVAMVLPILLGYDFQYSFYGLIGVGAMRLLYLLWLVALQRTWRIDLDLVRKWIHLALPLILYAILGGLLPAFDAWLVGYLFGGDEEMFAVFRYGAQELPLALALTNAFSNVMVVEVAADLKKALPLIKARSLRLFHLLFPLSILLMILSPFLFPWIFNADFEKSVPVFQVYLFVIISRLVFSSTILIGLKANRVLTWIGACELLINIALSFYLGQKFGLVGIALGTLVAFTFEKAAQCIYLSRKHGISPKEYLDFRWFFGYSALLLTAFLFS